MVPLLKRLKKSLFGRNGRKAFPIKTKLKKLGGTNGLTNKRKRKRKSKHRRENLSKGRKGRRRERRRGRPRRKRTR